MTQKIQFQLGDIDNQQTQPAFLTEVLQLVLTVTDPESRAELEAKTEGRRRCDFALDALKIGLKAIRLAQGQIDTDFVRNESKRMVSELAAVFENAQNRMSTTLTSSLRDYFDPESGRFNERVDRLVKKNGELEQVLQQHVGDTDSELVRTLAAHLGEQSPLLMSLDPEASDGFLAAATAAVEKSLKDQRERILDEFSLDNKQGALSRLVTELKEQHGQVEEALETRVGDIVSEFSLDHEDSALSRLVKRVEQAQKQISDEFSLDEDGSALARLRRELLNLMDTQRNANEAFQRDVLEKLTEMTARKSEAERGTRHGDDFEDEVFSLIDGHSQKAGDVATQVGRTTGLIRNCKVGDAVVELGPDSGAPGARIVVEAKQRNGFNLSEALESLETARKNRGATTGLFAFSARLAPKGLAPMARYGDSIVLIWDAEDPSTDVVLEAGLSVAKALCTRERRRTGEQDASFSDIERAIREIEKQVNGLTEISTFAGTIQSHGKKIAARADRMSASLTDQIGILDESITKLQHLKPGFEELSQ